MRPIGVWFRSERLPYLIGRGRGVTALPSETSGSQMKYRRIFLREFLKLLVGGSNLLFGLAGIGKKSNYIGISGFLLED